MHGTSKPHRPQHHQQQQQQQQHSSNRYRPPPSTTPSLELTLVGHGKVPDTRVWIRIADLDAREAEMQQAAKQFQIPADRWHGSLLYRQYYHHTQKRQHASQSKLTLDPETDCIERNYSYAMQWEDWLTDLLVQYYETGRLNIPDVCQGSDLLLLLEYFGILYAPDQLIFASYAAYQRVRAWSDYLTQRVVLADHLMHLSSLVVPVRSAGRVYQLGTVESPGEKLTLLPRRGDTTPVYSWGCDVTDLPSQSHLQPQSLPPSRVIYNLFNITKENKVAEALRDDFGIFLQNLLPACDINFSVKMVQVRVGNDDEPYRGKRAVLKLSMESNRTQSQLSHPVDEITMNRHSPVPIPPQATAQSDSSAGKPPFGTSATSGDHVYYELEGTPEPTRPVKFTMEQRQRSIDPVMAGNTEGFKAPLEVIDHNDTGTVTSALTGPFNGGETSLADEDVRAEALRQEWVQGSLLNRDIDGRMKALLEGDGEMRGIPSPIAEEEPEEDNKRELEGGSKREPGTPETTPSVASESPNMDSPTVDRGCQPWEWFNAVCGGYFDVSEVSPIRKVQNNSEQKANRRIQENETNRPSPEAQNLETVESQKACEILLPPKQATVVMTPSPINVPCDGNFAPILEHAKETNPAPSSQKITSHEGVKQRLAELREKMEREGKDNPPKVQPQQSTKVKAAVAAAAIDAKTKKIAKETIDRNPSPSKRNSGFFQRNRQAKPTSKKNTKATTPRSTPKKTAAVPPAKNTPGPTPRKTTAAPQPKKKTSLMKMFRRGNE